MATMTTRGRKFIPTAPVVWSLTGSPEKLPAAAANTNHHKGTERQVKKLEQTRETVNGNKPKGVSGSFWFNEAHKLASWKCEFLSSLCVGYLFLALGLFQPRRSHFQGRTIIIEREQIPRLLVMVDKVDQKFKL